MKIANPLAHTCDFYFVLSPNTIFHNLSADTSYIFDAKNLKELGNFEETVFPSPVCKERSNFPIARKIALPPRAVREYDL